jgi:hypothetical protein
MNSAKIHLSPDELMLVKYGEWILTKNVVIQKVYTLFGVLAEHLQEQISKNNLLRGGESNSAKISKGENYNGLPYVMMDCPRLFAREDVFSVRTFFWWGNYFSVTLHLKGRFQQIFAESIRQHTDLLAQNEFFLCVAGDQWEHDLRSANYLLLRKLSCSALDGYFTDPEFVKLSARIDFTKWDKSEQEIIRLYEVIVRSIRS